MIMTRTPFRISFAGGGSDLESFYQTGYGAVVSTSISRYMYLIVHPFYSGGIRLKYSQTEQVRHADQIQHPIVRESLRLLGITGGVEIASFADVPAGTGIGSSGSFTVGLLHALHTFQGQFVTKETLAREACRIEIDILGEPIGKQDQYAASYGGLNYIRFDADGSVTVDPIVCAPSLRQELGARLLLFDLGQTRNASSILSEQKDNMRNPSARQKVQELVRLADNLRDELRAGNLESLGEILHEGWMYKQELARSISSPYIEECYQAARRAGAKGGKLIGAGGGGFLLLYSRPECHDTIRKMLNLREVAVVLETEGSKVLFFDP